MSETKKRNIFHMPHAYAFTVILILVCGVLTHIIPTGAFSMSITGVAQDICQLPIYSAAGFRLVCMVVFIAVNSIWVIHYIKTIRKDPAKSLLYGTDAAMQDDNAELPELTFRRKLAVAIFVTGVIVLIYGSTHGWDSYTELPMIMVMPTSGFLMASLGMAGVKYEAWMKFYFKYFILQALVACGLLAIANFMGLGPF